MPRYNYICNLPAGGRKGVFTIPDYNEAGQRIVVQPFSGNAQGRGAVMD